MITFVYESDVIEIVYCAKIATSLSLMRRLPPSKIEQNLTGLLNLVPEEADEISQRVDQPLQEALDTEMVGTLV